MRFNQANIILCRLCLTVSGKAGSSTTSVTNHYVHKSYSRSDLPIPGMCGSSKTRGWTLHPEPSYASSRLLVP